MSVGPLSLLRLTLLEKSLKGIAVLGRRMRGPSTRPAHLQIGERGEVAAYFYLRRLGRTIVARQWRCAKLRGDLDLVAWQDDTLCFVEVKTRGKRDAFAAEVAVDKEKRIMLRKMARAYLRQLENAQQIAVRFDILTVYFVGKKPDFQIISAAFGWGEPEKDRWY